MCVCHPLPFYRSGVPEPIFNYFVENVGIWAIPRCTAGRRRGEGKWKGETRKRNWRKKWNGSYSFWTERKNFDWKNLWRKQSKYKLSLLGIPEKYKENFSTTTICIFAQVNITNPASWLVKFDVLSCYIHLQVNITKPKFAKWRLAILWKFTDKEIREIKINSVPNNTKDLCRNTKTIIRLRLGDYRVPDNHLSLRRIIVKYHWKLWNTSVLSFKLFLQVLPRR